MIRGILLALLMAPSAASALDLKFGLMYVRDPLYNGVYPDGDKNYVYEEQPIVGRIELIQKFRIEKNATINLFITHMSQFTAPDPHYGINAIGAELEFNFNLFK